MDITHLWSSLRRSEWQADLQEKDASHDYRPVR